jgi:xanthine dehydrogenase/oxidase
METQTATASILDGEYVQVVCGAQDITTTQSKIAAALGVAQNKVVVSCPRLGGGFGGKISGNFVTSIAAALCSKKLKKPVRIFNTRTADMAMQGGREGWRFDYEVGFSDDGLITALKYNIYIDGGMNCGDTIGSMQMGLMWADNTYYLPNFLADAKFCFTNTAPCTAMRAPGVVQSCFAIEAVVDRVAFELKIPNLTVQQRNFLTDGETTILGQPITDCTLPNVWNTLLQRSRYEERLKLCQNFNAANLWRKKGISICPVKYGMGWSYYNAGIKIGVRQADGTITVTHSGAEMGQGINTKVAQTVAYALGVSISLIRVTAIGTDKVVNGGITGGSGTSEVVCQAALNACATLNARLDPYRSAASVLSESTTTAPAAVAAAAVLPSNNKKKLQVRTQQSDSTWRLLLASLPCDVSLNVEGWYSPAANPNNQPFQYFVYAACVSEIELDVLSGEMHVLASELTYDCGQSLNPAVDIGQIEGAFMMGLGYFLTEHKEYSAETALLETNGTWEYKPPMVQEIPSVFNVTLLKNMYNTDGILGSKAVGEPPMVTANSIYFALRQAIAAARLDAGNVDYFDLPVPATVAERQRACLVSPARFAMPC